MMLIKSSERGEFEMGEWETFESRRQGDDQRNYYLLHRLYQ
jgi:hypothetical protein